MKFGLGTVQFGVDYGISNNRGCVPESEVENILLEAEGSGVWLLDTAAHYGTSEEVIGRNLPPDHRFKIVTKTMIVSSDKITASDEKRLEDTLNESLRRLKSNSVYGLLVHSADNVLAPGGHHIVNALLRVKAQGKTQKIGVSVYSPDQISSILEIFTPDLIQLPINIFDQRMLKTGTLNKLKSLGVEIHARSLYLQGLLLMPLGKLDSRFMDYLPHFELYQEFLIEKKMTPIQAVFAFVRGLEGLIDVALIGVTNKNELAENACNWKAGSSRRQDFSHLSTDEEFIINPLSWLES